MTNFGKTNILKYASDIAKNTDDFSSHGKKKMYASYILVRCEAHAAVLRTSVLYCLGIRKIYENDVVNIRLPRREDIHESERLLERRRKRNIQASDSNKLWNVRKWRKDMKLCTLECSRKNSFSSGATFFHSFLCTRCYVTWIIPSSAIVRRRRHFFDFNECCSNSSNRMVKF